MKTTKWLFTVLFILSGIAFAQEQNADDAHKAYMEYLTPGHEHQMLAKGTGDWTYDQKFWMAPGTDPQTTSGTVKGEMIMGGRYLQMDVIGTAWGMPFEGRSIEGFDNAAKEYFMIWIDNMGTGFATAKGVYNKDKNRIDYNGSMIDPVSKKEITFKQSSTMIDDNTFLLEMFMADQNGNDFKVMETKYMRKM